MGEKDTISKDELVYAGICDFKGLYNFMYEWLSDEGFDVLEEKYKETVKGDAKELEIKWKANKKYTDFFRGHIEIGWKTLNMKEVEVEIDGKKKKMAELSELKIKTKAILEQDHEGKWAKSSFQRFLKETYTKYIAKERREEMESKIEEIMVKFIAEMKSYLQLSGKHEFRPRKATKY